MKNWNPNASCSGLDPFEQSQYQANIRSRYKPNETQRRYDKICIRCHTHFNMPEEDYFHTECVRCREILGLKHDPPPKRIIQDPRDTDHGKLASREYTEESKEIIRLFLGGNREAALKAMLDMAEKYPGRGWEEAHDDLIATLGIEPAEELEKLPF